LCYSNYKKEKKTELQATPVQLKYKLIIMLLYKEWDNKTYIVTMVKILRYAGDKV